MINTVMSRTDFLVSLIKVNLVCLQASKVALVSKHGIHQLHMFIFVLALMQIVYSFLTVSLARAKVSKNHGHQVPEF